MSKTLILATRPDTCNPHRFDLLNEYIQELVDTAEHKTGNELAGLSSKVLANLRALAFFQCTRLN